MTNSAPRKNVVMISFDDAVAFWKYKTIFGETLQTPNLDRICAQSTAFHSAYCQAPVCSPSRASFMSGKSPHQTGITDQYKHYFETLPPEKMWPYRLKKEGYFCSSGDKVMQGYTPLLPEIHDTLFSDHPKTFRVDWKIPEAISIEMGGFRGGRAADDPIHDKRFYDHQSANSAISFIEEYDDDAPFYREVGFYGPHGPWITPRRFKDMYDERKIKTPEPWKDGFDDGPFMNPDGERSNGLDRFQFWRKSVRNYFSALTHTDQHLGRVWDAIKASPHADNTIIVIVSDHGMHLGERKRFGKRTLWEQVANVPVIIHDPSQPNGKVVTDPVALLDVGPTVMDFLGLEPLEDCIGQSLRPQMDDKTAPDRAVPTFLGNSAAVIKGKYRFIRYEDGSTQFYDLSKDWWQTKDLGSGHPDYAQMETAHAACCKEYGLDIQTLKTAA
jgi:arylsulfatase A-like enzyme